MINQEIIGKYIKYKDSLLYYCGILALIIITFVYINQIIIASNNLFSTDFYKFYQSVRFYFAGQNIYSDIIRPLNQIESLALHKTHIILPSDLNPPFLTMLLTPYAWLSYGQALLCWSVITFFSTVLGISLVIKSYPSAWQNPTIRMYLLAALLIYFPSYANFFLGQLSSILLLITTAAWLNCRKKSYGTAGVLLGFALCLKLFFGLFLLFFLIRKQWRALCLMIITYLSCCFSALIFFGVATYQNYLFTLNHIRWYASSWNASLLGFFYRVFGIGHEGNHPLINAPLFGHFLYTALALLLLIYFIYQIRQSYQQENNLIEMKATDELDWQFSLTLVVMLLLSPLAWLYYFTLLMIPFITIVRLSHKLKQFNFNFCLLIFILLLSGSPTYYRLPTEMVKTSMVITWANYYFYALFLLLLLLIKIRYQMNNREIAIIPVKSNTKFTANMQLLLYMLAVYPSFIIFAFASLKIIG